MLELLGEYMLLRQLVTPIVFMFWFVSKKYRYEEISLIFVLGISTGLLYVYPKLEVAALWAVFCYVMFLYGERVSGDHVFAACFAVSSAHFGGWLYEIPFFHPASMFYSFRYPWLVNTQIISGLFCVWLLAKRKIEANRTMLYGSIIYVLVTLFWLSGYRIYFPVRLWWLPRVGVMIPLWSTLTGIKGEKKK